MNHYTSSIRILAAFLSTGALACASVKMGDDSELFGTATAAYSYNDNLFLSNSATKGDSILDFSPGIQYVFGQNSPTNGQISYSEDFQEYASNSGLDTNLALIDLQTNYDDGTTKVGVAGWFHQLDQATRDVRGNGFLVHRNWSHASIIGENEVTAKTSLSLGFAYDDTNYAPENYRDWAWFQIPATFYFKVEPKLDVGLGLTYQNNQIGGNGINSDQYFYNLSMRGEISPKLTGEVHVGLIEFDPARGQSQSALGLSANLNYAYSQKTNFTLGASNSYGYDALGDSYRISTLSTGMTAAVSSNVNVSGQLFYNHYTYVSTIQRADFYGFQIGTSYVVNQYVTLNASYSYARNSSNIGVYTFGSNIFSVSATLRY